MTTADDRDPAIFALERLDWAAPDRLEVRGTFTASLPDAASEPVLRVYGDDGVHELRCAGLTGDPLPGEPWRADFAWQDPPTAFTAAELVLGEVRIDLTRSEGDDRDDGPDASAHPSEPDGATRLRLEAELLAERERSFELERDLERARGELEHARQELEDERSGRAQDAVRFREGLASVERAAGEELQLARERLQGAEDARAQAEQLRAQLADAVVRRTRLREQVLAAADDVQQALGRMLEADQEPDGTAGRQ